MTDSKTIFAWTSERQTYPEYVNVSVDSYGIKITIRSPAKGHPEISGLVMENATGSLYLDGKQAQALAEALLKATRGVDVDHVVASVASDNDGIEQDAFEEWAKSEKFNMHEHPLHWLFMDPKTDAARRGWRAGIRHAQKRIVAALFPDGMKKDG